MHICVLGIGVTYLVGELVLQKIGGLGSTCLTVKDFQRFISDFSAYSYREGEAPSLGIYVYIHIYVFNKNSDPDIRTVLFSCFYV
jgi:hypothetical protein